jgi:hypothetical protein
MYALCSAHDRQNVHPARFSQPVASRNYAGGNLACNRGPPIGNGAIILRRGVNQGSEAQRHDSAKPQICHQSPPRFTVMNRTPSGDRREDTWNITGTLSRIIFRKSSLPPPTPGPSLLGRGSTAISPPLRAGLGAGAGQCLGQHLWSSTIADSSL